MISVCISKLKPLGENDWQWSSPEWRDSRVESLDEGINIWRGEMDIHDIDFSAHIHNPYPILTAIEYRLFTAIDTNDIKQCYCAAAYELGCDPPEPEKPALPLSPIKLGLILICSWILLTIKYQTWQWIWHALAGIWFSLSVWVYSKYYRRITDETQD